MSFDASIAASRGYSIRLPRPLWVGVSAGVLILAGIVLRVGLPIYRQHVAIAEVERVAGHVFTREVRPAWAKGWFPETRIWGFDAIERVDLSECQFADRVLVQLRLMRGLANVLDYSTMFPGGLGGQRGYASLELGGANITDASLLYLNGLRGLEALTLRNTRVTDTGLTHLRSLDELMVLDLSGTQVTDSGLIHLIDLPNLSLLDVSNTSVTEDAVAALKDQFAELDRRSGALPHLSVQR